MASRAPVAVSPFNPVFQAVMATSSQAAMGRLVFVGRVYTPKPARLSARPLYRWTATDTPGSAGQNYVPRFSLRSASPWQEKGPRSAGPLEHLPDPAAAIRRAAVRR